MNASDSLILIDQAGLTAESTLKARELVDEALAVGALIGAVRNPAENEQAVQAQKDIKAVLNQINEAYRGAKQPIVELGRKLDLLSHSLADPLEAEYARLGNLAGQFALAERRRIAAEESLAREKMAKLEAEKMAALASTSDPVKQSETLEMFSRRQAAEAPVPQAPMRAKGQKVKEDWQILVVNIIETAKWALMTGRWDVLDIGIRQGAVKELLRGGMKEIPGLDCKPTVQSQVTMPKQKAIDV